MIPRILTMIIVRSNSEVIIIYHDLYIDQIVHSKSTSSWGVPNDETPITNGVTHLAGWIVNHFQYFSKKNIVVT